MAEVATTGTLTETDVPVSPSTPESSDDLKAKLSPTPTPEVKDAPKSKSPYAKPDTRASDEIRKQIESAKRDGNVNADPKAVSNKVGQETKGNDGKPAAQEVEDRSKWFDPDKGFKTPEDMKKSYSELQSKLTKQSEEVKLEKSRLELEQSRIQKESEKLKEIETQRVLTPEEQAKQDAIKQWEVQNKEALDLIESKITERLTAKQQAEKQQEVQSTVANQILKERQDWLDSFNKDDGRKKLWPAMEDIYKGKGNSVDSAIQDFAKNPLPYIEAMAFHKTFPTIAEQIKAEAVQQFVAKQKEAAEVERKNKVALPGGPKVGTGDVDISQLSSKEIGSLLPRNENG